MPRTISVALSDEDWELIQSVMNLHLKLGHIPEPTPSAYLRWLLTENVQGTLEELQKRRQRITG